MGVCLYASYLNRIVYFLVTMQDTIGEYIELNAFLKKLGLAATGGQAKMIIRAENVKVNGEVETRNKKKLRQNDVVEYNGKKYVVGHDGKKYVVER